MLPTLTAWHVKYITHTVHLCCAIVYALAVKKKKRKTRGERKYDIQRVFCWEQAGCASDAGDPRKPCGRQGCLRCRSRGRKLPRKWGAYLLSSHPTCAHQPFKILPFLLKIGDRIGDRLLLVAQDLAKGAVLGQSTATAAMAVRSKREECRRCSLAEMIGWGKGALLRLCSAERDVVLTMCISVTLSANMLVPVDFNTPPTRTWNGPLTGMHHAKMLTDSEPASTYLLEGCVCQDLTLQCAYRLTKGVPEFYGSRTAKDERCLSCRCVGSQCFSTLSGAVLDADDGHNGAGK